MGRGRGDQEGNEKGRQGIGVMMGRPGRHVSVGMARWRQDRTAELGRKDGGDELAQMGRGAEGEGRINGEGEKGGASGVEQKRGTEREGEKGGASGMEQNMPRKIPPGLAERLRKRGILMDS